MPRAKILVVEDDKDISELIRYNLEREGYEVIAVFDGLQALEAAARFRPGLVILDIMLPHMDGMDLCRQLKSQEEFKAIPMIMLTAKSEESDILVGLQMGADDYITKPFSPKVLAARVKALLRRCGDQASESSAGVRVYGGLTIDVGKHRVLFKGQEIVLTAMEFAILEFLSRMPGRVFSRDQILDRVWKEGKFIVDRAVDVHILGLRRKLGPGGELLETVRGVGYRFKDLDE